VDCRPTTARREREVDDAVPDDGADRPARPPEFLLDPGSEFGGVLEVAHLGRDEHQVEVPFQIS
jgi:hypothetical protein